MASEEEEEMLAFLGLSSMQELFNDIPPQVRVEALALPPGMGEQEVVEKFDRTLSLNRAADRVPTFLGAGYYDHYVPAAVDAILSRSEFYTSYTPYQPEVSQGMLQALWEYQALVCELTGMDAANSSLYDGSTALGEAAIMSARITGRTEYVIPRAISWEKKAVLRSYAAGPGLRVREVDYDRDVGGLDLGALGQAVGQDTAGVYVESPNLLGVLEEHLEEVREASADAVLTVGVNPISLGILEAPGEAGADIVIGEGQCLGGALNYGGPSLGVFACRQEHVRRMPGRVIGATRDADGRRAFCMTLQTREQHIRRDKAMSNICTNEALMAVGAAVFLALLGRTGLRDLAWRNVRQAKELMARLSRLRGFRVPRFRGTVFNEFTLEAPRPYGEAHRHLLAAGVQGGLPLAPHLPELERCALFTTTERHTREDHEALARALGELA
jgi:glycine dehydrogenase subunit 1